MNTEQIQFFKQMFENALQLPEKEQLVLLEGMANQAKQFMQNNSDFQMTPELMMEMMTMFAKLSPAMQEKVKEIITPFMKGM
ncbi:hypothetical protein DFP93_13321 [Aneurinibacillus soli]|uniref:Uncharacterized protein n=1 Tax=Aneurinibacillus soli TaxID=1500254 RepID=A0A0U5AYF9_9BACL|nr:hypothetical protein [Aneurinibacillus soli]PYE57161.1 hypothetical protein DFP93_13321 [Aneurinibacillus soli]BAU25983.1 hypothetical protein CB4_00043 [Aneurinibacillus soli]